jgi:cell wall-associated NlpC family hydrolase
MNKRKNLRDRLLDEARQWVGVRFRHQGRTRRGVDCSGLVVCVAGKVLGFDPNEYIGQPRYGKKPDIKELRQGLKTFCVRIKESEARPGDVVLMSFDNEPTHIGFLTSTGIIHSTAQKRGVVEQGLDSRLRIISYYRIPAD